MTTPVKCEEHTRPRTISRASSCAVTGCRWCGISCSRSASPPRRARCSDGWSAATNLTTADHHRAGLACRVRTRTRRRSNRTRHIASRTIASTWGSPGLDWWRWKFPTALRPCRSSRSVRSSQERLNARTWWVTPEQVRPRIGSAASGQAMTTSLSLCTP